MEKTGSHLEKWITLEKKGQTCINVSYVEKEWVSCGKKEFTLGKMGHLS